MYIKEMTKHFELLRLDYTFITRGLNENSNQNVNFEKDVIQVL